MVRRVNPLRWRPCTLSRVWSLYRASNRTIVRDTVAMVHEILRRGLKSHISRRHGHTPPRWTKATILKNPRLTKVLARRRASPLILNVLLRAVWLRRSPLRPSRSWSSIAVSSIRTHRPSIPVPGIWAHWCKLRSSTIRPRRSSCWWPLNREIHPIHLRCNIVHIRPSLRSRRAPEITTTKTTVFRTQRAGTGTRTGAIHGWSAVRAGI